MESHGIAPGHRSIGTRLARIRGERHVSQNPDPVRRLRLGGGFDELERIAKEDEDRMAEEVRARAAEQARLELAEREAEIRTAALRALRAVEDLRALLRGDSSGTMKALDHHARRLRGHLDALRRP